MKLNAVQAASLRRLLAYRTNSPSLGERLRLTAVPMLLWFAVAVLVRLITVRLDIPGGTLLAVGLFVGAAFWNAVQQKHFVDWWPLNREITDWSKVGSLLADAQGTDAPPPVAPVWRQKRRQMVLLGALLFTMLLGLMFAGERALAFAHDPRRGNPPDGVVVLTASWCGYCMQLREQLALNRIPYTDIDVEKSAEGRWAFTAVHGTGVPITIVGEQVIRGNRWPQLDRALKAAGYLDFRKRSTGDSMRSDVSGAAFESEISR
jgi:glutaredoxin